MYTLYVLINYLYIFCTLHKILYNNYVFIVSFLDVVRVVKHHDITRKGTLHLINAVHIHIYIYITTGYDVKLTGIC